MPDDEESELSDFEKLITAKVGEVEREHYKDEHAGDMWAALGWRMNAMYAIQGKDLTFDPYKGAGGGDRFFEDYPEVKKLLDDPEIAAVRDDEVKKVADEFDSCWGVTWDKNEIAFIMFTSVANEADFKITDEENFARQDANAFCKVRFITDTKGIEKQFDEKEEIIRNHTKPADMGIHVNTVNGEVQTSTRGANVYSSEHFARSIVKSGKLHEKEFMIKILSGCKHISNACTFKAVKRIKDKLITNWLNEFGIKESELVSVPKLSGSSYGSGSSSGSPATSSGSGCFIATAAYGTPFAEEINVLRNWRDQSLLINAPGRFFVQTYYKFSPPVADNIRSSSKKKKIVRFLLDPFVKILSGKYTKDRN